MQWIAPHDKQMAKVFNQHKVFSVDDPTWQTFRNIYLKVEKKSSFA